MARIPVEVSESSEAPRAREAKFRALFEKAPDGLILADGEGRRIEANAAACEILGRRREEVLGERLFEPAEPPDLVEELWRRLLEEGRSSGELRLRRPDGTTRDVDFQATANVFEGCHLAVLRDVTERKRREVHFLQTQKMEAVGRLAGGLAHDFNNLLTVVNGYTDMLLASLPGPDPRRPLVEEVKSAGQRSAALTRQLLAFSRKQILHPEVVGLNGVMKGMEELLRKLAGEGVVLEVSPAPSELHIRIDPGQLEQVILSLAANARDAMPEGGKLLIEAAAAVLDESYAERHPEVAPGPYARLEVSDTGCGMDRETLSRAFEPFFTTKGPDRGTGLGLATVYGIVRQSGGQISFHSEPGRGTRCDVLLPRVLPEATAPAPARPSPNPAGKETVLLVEDEDAVRRLARRILEMQGYCVLEASRPEEAEALSASHHGTIHLLLTDVVMPVASGRKLADRLLGMRPALKVLYMSGYTDDAIVRHGVLEDDMAFLQKPFTPLELARRVRQVLDA